MQFYSGTSIEIGTLSSANANLIVDEYLTPNLFMFRQIPVHDEQLIPSSDRETWKTLWGNILANEEFTLVRAGKVLSIDDFYVDRKYGKVTFADQTSEYKIPLGTTQVDIYCADGTPAIEVMASYTFDYFPADILYGMVKQSLNVVNSMGNNASPTGYTIDNMPNSFLGPVTDIAFSKCIERLMMDYDLWKSRLIFAIGPDSLLDGQGGDIVSQLQTLQRSAEERAYKVLDNPRFKTGYHITAPTQNYWKAVRGIGSSGGQSGEPAWGGRYRGWRPNRVSM